MLFGYNLLYNSWCLSYYFNPFTDRGFKSGLQSPAIPDEAAIKRATPLNVSETINTIFIPTLGVGESGSFGFTFIESVSC